MKSIVFFKYVLTILFALYITYVRADFTAKVQRVVDGDTVHVEDEAGKKFKVRLTGIDAPEQNQPYGLASTYHLRGLLLNKFVLLESKPKKGKPYSVDRYKRVLAKIILDGRDINLSQVLRDMLGILKDTKNNKVQKIESYTVKRSFMQRKIN